MAYAHRPPLGAYVPDAVDASSALAARDALRALAAEAADVAALRLVSAARGAPPGVTVVHVADDACLRVRLSDVAARVHRHDKGLAVAAVRAGAERRPSAAAVVQAALAQLLPNADVPFWDASAVKEALSAANITSALVAVVDCALVLPEGDLVRVLRFLEAAAGRVLVALADAASFPAAVPLHVAARMRYGPLSGLRTAADYAADAVGTLLGLGHAPSDELLAALLGDGSGLRDPADVERLAVLALVEHAYRPAAAAPPPPQVARLALAFATLAAAADAAGARGAKAALVQRLHALGTFRIGAHDEDARALAFLRRWAADMGGKAAFGVDPGEWTSLADAVGVAHSIASRVSVPPGAQLALRRSAAKMARPRVHETLLRALEAPAFYGGAAPALADACAAHAALRAAGTHVNMRDWLVGFAARADGAPALFDAPGGESAVCGASERQTAAVRRFLHAVLQLQLLGLVVPSRRRREHYERVFFFGTPLRLDD